MQPSLTFLGIVFTSIILLSIFVTNNTENFDSQDSVLNQIQKLDSAFKTLKRASTNKATQTLDTPKGPLPVSDIISQNLTNISRLNKTYNDLLNGPDAYNLNAIKDKMQKSINEFIDRFNYINNKLDLKLPEMEKENINTVTTCTKQVVKSIPNLKPATEYAIDEAKIDPVITAIQSVQDAYISLKENVINSGIKLINTPKGEIPVKRMIEENIENLNDLAKKYQLMLQGDAPSDPNYIKKYVQKNLNIIITAYDYIIVSLNLKQRRLQKNMIKIPESRDKPEIQSAPPIEGQTFNKLLSLPLAQLNSIIDAQVSAQKTKQLSTQYSTHGFEPPPVLISKPPSALPPALPNITFAQSVKPYSPTHIFDRLSPNTQLATQNTTLE
jgi:hypothetical protein